MTRFQRAASTLGTGYLLFFLLSVFSLILTSLAVTRLGQDGYGLWAVVIGIGGYVALLDFGLSATVVRLVAYERDAAAARQTLGSILTLYLGVAALACVAGVIAAMSLKGSFDLNDSEAAPFSWAVFLVCLRVALSFPTGLYAGVLRGTQLGYLSDGVAMGGALVSFAGSVFLLEQGWGLLALAVPPVVVSAAQALPLITLVRRYVPQFWIGPGRLNRSLLTAVGFSVFIFLNGVAANIVFATDLIVAGTLVSAAAAGIYQITGRVSQLIMAIGFRVADATLPALTDLHGRGEPARAGRVYLETVKLSTAVALPCAVIYAVYNEDFVRIWLSPVSYGGFALTLAFAYLVVHHTVLHAGGLALVGTGNVRVPALLSLLEAGLNVAFSIPLAVMLGLPGIALGTIAAGLLTSAWYTPWTVCRSLNIPVPAFIAECLVRPAMPALLLVVVAVGLHSIWPPRSYLDLGVATMGLLGAYIGVFGFVGLSALERARYVTRLRSR